MHRTVNRVALLAIVLSTAQFAHPFASQRVTQVGSSEAIAVDFYALGTDGAPIGDLKAEEVQVRVDGRPRPVKWLEFVPLADVPTAEGAAPVPLIPAPFGSNAAHDAGRSFVIAIENDSFRPGRERPLRAAVDRFLATLCGAIGSGWSRCRTAASRRT